MKPCGNHQMNMNKYNDETASMKNCTKAYTIYQNSSKRVCSSVSLDKTKGYLYDCIGKFDVLSFPLQS